MQWHVYTKYSLVILFYAMKFIINNIMIFIKDGKLSAETILKKKY